MCIHVYIYIDYIILYVYIYIWCASATFAGNVACFWPNLGTKEGATILQLRILDPRLLGDVQCENLEFKIKNNLFWNSGRLNIACIKKTKLGFKIQDFKLICFLGILNLESIPDLFYVLLKFQVCPNTLGVQKEICQSRIFNPVVKYVRSFRTT